DYYCQSFDSGGFVLF
nr:immunoglobulin light chain junction region [Macaca mulatta]